MCISTYDVLKSVSVCGGRLSPPKKGCSQRLEAEAYRCSGHALSTYRPGSPLGELSCGGMLVRLDSAAHATDFQAKGAIAGRHSRNHGEV